MKKILFLNNTLATGGAEKVLVNILNNLDLSQYEITLLTIYDEIADHFILRKEIRRISFFTRKSKILRSLSYKLFCRIIPASLLYRIIVKEKYDVEVAFLEGLPTKIISGNNKHKCKKIAWVHTDLEVYRGSDYAFKDDNDQSASYKQFDEIVLVSRDVKEAFTRRFGNGYSLNVIYNLVDEKEVLIKSKRPITSPFHDGQFHFVSVGRLVKPKGYDRLLLACSMLQKKGIGFDLCIVGEGPERENLEQLIKMYHLENQVILYGYSSNPYSIIAMSDALVISSHTEGYPLALVECLIIGKPVVATNVTGPKEILENGNWGLLVDSDAESIFKGMEKMTYSEIYNFYKQKAVIKGKEFRMDDILAQISQVIDT